MMNAQKNARMRACSLCPRDCKADRAAGQTGVCRVPETLKVARAALHFWEEPCISGHNGSGAVFFSGCPLHCVFCQNKEIADGRIGVEIEKERLAEIFLELQEQHANNINLVTGTQYVPQIVWAVESARRQGLTIPVLYNTGSYEHVDTIRRLEGIVDVYLPDFKYMDSVLSSKYSHAPDYSRVVKASIAEMVRQQPRAVLAKEPQHPDTDVMQKGVIVRQLLLPGALYDAKHVLKYLYETYGNQIYYSLMSQYTPLDPVKNDPVLSKRVTKEAYETLVDYAAKLGVENGFIQEREVAVESFIPHFDCEGVLRH